MVSLVINDVSNGAAGGGGEVVEAGDNPRPGWCLLSVPAGDTQDWDQHSRKRLVSVDHRLNPAAIKCIT